MRRIISVLGCGVFLLAQAAGSQPVQAQVATSPWFVGGGSYGTGVVDDFLNEVADALQVAPQQKAPPGANSQSPATASPAPQANTTPPKPPRPGLTGAKKTETARGRYTENPRKWGQVYLFMRQGEESFSMQERPRRLTSSQLDPVNGKIRWPQVFLHPKYKKLRSRIEELFVQRAATGPTPLIATEIHDVIVEVIEKLRGDIEELPANDYVAARKFIDALDYSVVAPSSSP
jgi:hypothetical protein